MQLSESPFLEFVTVNSTSFGPKLEQSKEVLLINKSKASFPA